jgi:hypothetical protein
MDLTVDIGLERIQRGLAAYVATNINDAIDEQNSVWIPRDAAWFAHMGRPDPGMELEYIAIENVYSGTIPSLITSPPSAYPNLSVMAYHAVPVGQSDDWMEHYLCTVSLDFMVKSLRSEEAVNARIQRTLEAGHSVLTSDYARRIPELSGEVLVPQISAMPMVEISDVFVRHTTSDPNDRSFYQHGSLTYRVDKFSTYS